MAVTNEVYVAINNDSQVLVLSGLSEYVTGTIDVGDPVGAVYSPVSNAVYVTNLDDNTVSVIGYPASV